MNNDRIIARTKGVIEACEEIRELKNETLSEQAMIVGYMHVKAIFDEEKCYDRKAALYNYENALKDIRHDIVKLYEGVYLAETMDEWTQGEHYAYKKIIDLIDEHLKGADE